jgi:hypothetical protein
MLIADPQSRCTATPADISVMSCRRPPLTGKVIETPSVVKFVIVAVLIVQRK